MQWINLVPEDAGVQRLKASNRRPVAARKLDAVTPYPSSHEVQVGNDGDTDREPVRDRRREERRKGGDRRKQHQPVLLDTRGRHNRRAIENRRQSDREEKPAATQHSQIDLYA